jgi:hypothetical protein
MLLKDLTRWLLTFQILKSKFANGIAFIIPSYKAKRLTLFREKRINAMEAYFILIFTKESL